MRRRLDCLSGDRAREDVHRASTQLKADSGQRTAGGGQRAGRRRLDRSVLQRHNRSRLVPSTVSLVEVERAPQPDVGLGGSGWDECKAGLGEPRRGPRTQRQKEALRWRRGLQEITGHTLGPEKVGGGGSGEGGRRVRVTPLA